MNFQTTPLATLHPPASLPHPTLPTCIRQPRFLTPLCRPASTYLASSPPLLQPASTYLASSPHSATLPPPTSLPHLTLPPCIRPPHFLPPLCHPASINLASSPHSATLHPPTSLPSPTLPPCIHPPHFPPNL